MPYLHDAQMGGLETQVEKRNTHQWRGSKHTGPFDAGWKLRGDCGFREGSSNFGESLRGEVRRLGRDSSSAEAMNDHLVLHMRDRRFSSELRSIGRMSRTRGLVGRLCTGCGGRRHGVASGKEERDG